MSVIRIERTRESNNRFRGIKIFIDGKSAGIIANGETKDFPVEPGDRKVVAKIDWCGSQEVVLAVREGETKILNLSGFKFSKWLMPACGGVIALHFILQITMNFSYTIILVFPVFLFLVYLLTFGRNKYLTLVPAAER